MHKSESIKAEQRFRTPFETVLDNFESHARSEREKGAYFENLVKAYLENEPKWKALYKKIWNYGDWRKTHWDGGEQDNIGIDLVAETPDGAFHAIQCKFYKRNLRQEDLKQFPSSGGNRFSQRYLVTTASWNRNVDDLILSMNGGLKTITRQDFEASGIDWATYGLDGREVALKPLKNLRDYQQTALHAVAKGFEEKDRGKLIMACGTGKTFTALKIAEAEAGAGKAVLFLVPSLALLSQTLTEWTQQTQTPMTAFAVCSDISVGHRKNNKDDDAIEYVTHEVAYPTNTDAHSLRKNFTEAQNLNPNSMRVVFSTYQSLSVIHEAQKLGLPRFDLVICDEAHRTTGQVNKTDKDSNFVKVHDENYIRAAKRLYMTATPRIYKEAAKNAAKSQDIVLYSMDNKEQFGELFYTLSFSEAVHRRLLVDYKLIVLTIDEKTIKQRLQTLLLTEDNDIVTDDAAKLIGCWKALAKEFRDNALAKGQKDETDDAQPMRRAVAFAQTIDGKKETVRSKAVARDFPEIIQTYQKWQAEHPESEDAIELAVEARHVDGGMNAQEKGEKLQWLKDEPEAGTCRILSNVRCLSEGVDVPALDAVLFLSARNSQVDIVQSVGRVMRRAEGKKLGYVILPVVIPSGKTPEKILADSKNWQAVWQVVNALRAHDPKIANSIARAEMGDFSGKIEICALADLNKAPQVKASAVSRSRKTKAVGSRDKAPAEDQAELPYEPSDLERGIIAMLVKRCGTRLYWPQWGEKIAKIGVKYRDSLETILDNPANDQARKHFQEFLAELQQNLNSDITRERAITMLAEQIIALPIFNALFGQYAFAQHNPIAKAMSAFLDSIRSFGADKEGRLLIAKAQKSLIDKTIAKTMEKSVILSESFGDEKKEPALEELYEEIAEQIGKLPDEGKQKILKTIYETIIQAMEPENSNTVVYTPIEAIDFINKSVAHVLKTEFDTDFNDKSVHVLEPFAGTGTFLARLIQSGAVAPAALPEFYQNRLWANEINLLAYYTACANIESSYHAAMGGDYLPFPHMSLTDTFTLPTGAQDGSQKSFNFQYFGANQKIIEAQNAAKINVILGNPPYGSAMTRAYSETVDSQIRKTYAADALNNPKLTSLYDGYIRAFRWASDRIGGQGVIAFITNAGFLDSSAAAGLRKHLAKDFSSLYIFNLRGNQRTQGEQSHQEGGKIFDSGSRAPAAISIMVKNPAAMENGKIYYHDIGNYLSRDEKLGILAEKQSIENLPWKILSSDAHGDWLNKRDNSFATFMPLGNKKDKTAQSIFEIYSRGVMICRDPWASHFSKNALAGIMERMIAFYNQCAAEKRIIKDEKQISWDLGLKGSCLKGIKIDFLAESIIPCVYRPFTRSYLYYKRPLCWSLSRMPQIFPNLGGKSVKNLVIGVAGVGGKAPFSVLISKDITETHGLGWAIQHFPLYLYDPRPDGSYECKEAITETGLTYLQSFYGADGEFINREDIFYYIYGLLHSPQYREKYKNNLMKELPRIPRVKSFADFQAFSAAGRKLAELHLNFDDFGDKGAKELAAAAGVELELPNRSLHFEDYRIIKMRYGGRQGAKDKSEIAYNTYIKVKNIPLEAYEYVINGRSAVDWVVDRQQIKTDKASGIKNDPNDYAQELGDPAYPLKLLLSVIRISLDTQKIINALPLFEI